VNRSTLASRSHGSGQPVIYLHGFFSDGRLWDPVIRELGDEFHQLTVDLPGHGGSSGWRGGWSELIFALDELVRSLDQPPVIMGYSMGARVLRQLLLKPGPKLHSAHLVAAHPGLEAQTAQERRRRDQRLADKLASQPLEESVRQWSSLPIFSGQERAGEGSLERQESLRRQQNPEGLAFALRALGSGTCGAGGAPARNAPIQLICGDRLQQDQDRTQALADQWPRARVTWLEGIGHNPILEDPSALSAHLKRFLRASAKT
jgi:2-succinyl-6-hydroxy-2,4-cyclohexadiene-1-carboxylate synthase